MAEKTRVTFAVSAPLGSSSVPESASASVPESTSASVVSASASVTSASATVPVSASASATSPVVANADLKASVATAIASGNPVIYISHLDTLESIVDAFYVVGSINYVIGIKTSFNRDAAQLVFVLTLEDERTVYIAIPTHDPVKMMHTVVGVVEYTRIVVLQMDSSVMVGMLPIARQHAQNSIVDILSVPNEPWYAEVMAALGEDNCVAIVWSAEGMHRLTYNCIYPGQFERAFRDANISMEENYTWNSDDLRCVSMNPSVYMCAVNHQRLPRATFYMKERGIREEARGCMLVFYE